MNNFYDQYNGQESQDYPNTYNLWKSSLYYDTDNFSVQNGHYDYEMPEWCLPSSSDFKPEEEGAQRSLLEEEVCVTPESNDIAKKNVITRSDLYKDPDLFYIEEVQEVSQTDNQEDHNHYPDAASSNEVSQSWTHYYWHKAGEGSSQDSRPVQNQRRPVQNKLQKKLATALAQPIKITKAESMMQKMGWQGGALGKSGNGITVPVAPDATYSTSTLGLGNKPRREPKTTERNKSKGKDNPKCKDEAKNKELNYKEYFKTNILLYMLEFVKDDSEIEMSFDYDEMWKDERKTIYKMVKNIIRNDTMAPIDFDNVAQMEILKDIHQYNDYVLIIDGESKSRLSIYKSAPDHVYLITSDDLKDPEEIVDEIDEENDESNEMTDEKEQANESCKDKKPNDPKKGKQLKNTGKNKEKQMEVDEEESNPFLKSITRNLKTKKDKDLSSKFNKNCNIDAEKGVNMDSKELTVLDKLMDYLLEFAEQDDYTEIRFLGPFDTEQIDGIIDFVNNIQRSMDNVDDTVFKRNDKLYNMLKSGEFRFKTKEGCNGSTVIHKHTTMESSQ